MSFRVGTAWGAAGGAAAAFWAVIDRYYRAGRNEPRRTSGPSHDTVQNHEKRFLLLRFGLVDHGDGLADPETLMELLCRMRRSDDDSPGTEPFLPGVIDELLSIHPRHLEIDDEKV